MNLDSDSDDDEDLEDSEASSVIDKTKDIKLNFSRAHTRYCRHDGRFKDTDLEFNDFINVLVPPKPKPSNCLLFEVIMLASDF
jgi:hypothetical protein